MIRGTVAPANVRRRAGSGSTEASTCNRHTPRAQRTKMTEYRTWFHERRRPSRGIRDWHLASRRGPRRRYRFRASDVPDGGSNASDAAPVKAPTSKWRLAMRRVVSLWARTLVTPRGPAFASDRLNAISASYPRPRHTGTGLERRPVSASSTRRAIRPCPTLTDGAGGFLPGVPLGCLGIGDRDQDRALATPGRSPLISGCRRRQRHAGASACYPPHLCRFRVSVAPAGGSN